MMEQDLNLNLGHILERRNSDNENQNPLIPVIQTRKLSEYKVILAPKQILPPTQRQIKDAILCRKSGMVPGAIRKYLLQKKKHEVTDAEDEEEEEEEEDQELEQVSDVEMDVVNAEGEMDVDAAAANANVAEEEEDDEMEAAATERHRQCRGHCCEAKTKSGGRRQGGKECRRNNNMDAVVEEEEDDDDEIAIVGEFRNHQVLGEVNSDRGGVQINGSAAASSSSPDSGQDDPFSPPEDEDPEQEESNNNNNTSSNKRRHSEAFTAVSPDTTTPDVTLTLPATPSTPTPSTSRVVRMSPHLEIESSPVILEFDVSPAEKRSRLETTPSKPIRGKRGGGGGGGSRRSSSRSTASTAESSDANNTDQEQRSSGRVGPTRKSRKVRVAGIEFDSPTDQRSWVRKNLIFQDNAPTSKCTLAPEDPELEKKVRKNVWKDVIRTFESNLEKGDQVPKPSHVGDLIKKAILGLGTRVAKDIPKAALDFFGKLVQKYPVSVGDEATEYYSSAFTQTSSESCTMAEFLFDVLNRVQADALAKVQSKPLPFFKLLTRMVVQQYKDYSTSVVKLRRPFFVQFLEEQDKVLSYNYFCKELVKYTFLLKNHQEEFKSVMRWVGLLSYHLRKHCQLDAEFQKLVDDFVETLAKPEHSSSTCEVVEAICDSALGLAVSFKIIVNKIQFESARDSSVRPSDSEIADYLQSLAKSDSIAGLKSDLQERRHSQSTDPYPNALNPISSLVAATVNKIGRIANKSSELQPVNLRGEAYLHKLCKKEHASTTTATTTTASSSGGNNNSNSSSSSGLKLADLLRQKHFPTVNPTDNFGNIPLHDAIAHGRFDAVTKFYEYCSDVDLPEELRVNVLAQNKVGDTPFHLAAVSTDQSEQMSRLLIFMAEKLQVKEEALKTLNHSGKMPFELAFNPAARKILKPHALEEWNFQLGDVYVHPSKRNLLQSLETKKLILYWSLNSSQQET